MTAPDILVARIAALELSVIEHPYFSEGLQALEESLERARVNFEGRKLKAKARLIYGLTGAGKTTLIEAFTGRYPTVSTSDGDVRRVVTVEMPRPSTQRSLVSAIMGGLGYRPRLRDNADQIIGSIVALVQRLGVGLIIIDEGHHMMAGTGMINVTEFLKSCLIGSAARSRFWGCRL